MSGFCSRGSLALAAINFGAEILLVVHGFYYIKIFVNYYGLDSGWQNAAQVVYLVWNAINDPLFGMVQDVKCGAKKRWINSRRKVVLLSGPVWTLTFMVFWIPWTFDRPQWLLGLHLMFSLALFDSGLTLCLSAASALIAESTTSHSGRTKLIITMEMAGFVGSFAIFFVDKVSNNASQFFAFQCCCAGIVVVSSASFVLAGLIAPSAAAQVVERKLEKGGDDETASSGQKSGFWKEVWKDVGQVLVNGREFWPPVLGNLFRISRIAGNGNFLAIYTETLVSPSGVLPLCTIGLSLFYQLCGSMPKLLILIMYPLLRRFGAWTTTMCTVVLSLVNVAVILFIGRHNPYAFLTFLVLESTLSRACYPAVYNIFFPDVIDEDMKRHKRSEPISTLIFTLNALFTKPAWSLPPIIIVTLLSGVKYLPFSKWSRDFAAPKCLTYGDRFTLGMQFNATLSTDGNSTVAATSTFPLEDIELESLLNRLFYAAVLFPAVCTILEALCLLPYRLKFRHRRDDEERKMKKLSDSTSKPEPPMEAISTM